MKSLEQSFLDSIARLKVSGEDPIMLLTTLSQSESSFLLSYDDFSLLASFFGWDSPLNLASTDVRSFAEWIRLSRSGAEEASPMVVSNDLPPSAGPSGLSTSDKELVSTSSASAFLC